MNEETLFHLAREKPPDERAAFLDEACAGDTALRQRLEILLAAHEQPDSYLQPATRDNGNGEMAPDGGRTVFQSGVQEGPGTIIGPYKLLQQIGEGGMGVVFMAEQSHPVRRTVALKIIKPGMDSRQVIARFEAERQALAMMDHPNIARVLDAGTTDSGRPYFVMELVKGVPITNYCDEHRLTPQDRLELFVHVCHAVQHAHQKGIIHRDLKPSNVLIAQYDGKPVPKVIDFGVAKATGQQLTERTMFTGFGDVIGTPEYMSPEQAELNQLDIDTRSDVYSLGVLLYELLTGTTPIEHKRVKEAALLEVLRVIREEEPPKPSTRLSTIAELPSIAAQRGLEPKKLSGLVKGELDWIVMKALEKDRTRRYDTANGLASDVHRYLHDEPVQACPPSAGYRFRKFARRNKGTFAACVAAVVILLLGLIGLTVSNLLINREKNQKEIARRSAEASALEARGQEALAKANAQAASAQEALARRRFYAAQTNLAMHAWEQGEPTRTLELLEGLRPSSHEQDLRAFEWYYLWQQCNRGLRFRLGGAAPRILYFVAFLPDGKTLATTDYKTITLWDVATGQQKGGFPSNAWDFSISADGKRLIGGQGEFGEVKLWEIDSGKKLASFEGTFGAAFSPDGSTLALTRRGAIEFRDVAGKERQSILRLGGEDDIISGVRFSPDGNRAVVGILNKPEPSGNTWSVHAQTMRRDGAKWHEDFAVRGHGWFCPAAFSPDGKTLAVGGDVLKVYATDSGQELRTLAGHAGIVYSVDFAPDGKSLASAGGDRSVRVWDWQNGTQKASYPHPAAIFSAVYSRDGTMIASAGDGGALRLWNVKVPDEPSVLQHQPGTVTSVAFTPDSATLVTALSGTARNPDDEVLLQSGGGVRLWDVARIGGDEREIELLSDSAGASLSLSNDGRRIAVRRGHEIELWDLSSRRRTAVLQGHSAQVLALAFSRDDRMLASAGADETVKLWDLGTLKPRLTLACPSAVSAVAFSPDGRALATGGGFQYVVLWDTQTGREHRVVQGFGIGLGPWTHCVVFSPDGRTLAGANQSGTVRLWDPATGQLRAELQGHTACARWIAFAPDGQTIATASDDATVRLWDVSTGQEKVTLRGHAGSVRSVAFSPDGRTLASGAVDGTVRLWRTSRDPVANALKTTNAADEAFQSSQLARAWYNFARVHATAADPAQRDPARVLEFASKAIELDPKLGRPWTMLGIAQYRMGKYNEAITALNKAVEIRGDDADGLEFFVLALTHWRLGEPNEARKWHDRAVAWLNANRSNDNYIEFHEELSRLEAEAQEVIDKPSGR